MASGITNWNESVRFTPQKEVTPGRPRRGARARAAEDAQALSHLQEIVRDTGNFPSPLRAVGSLHSLNECFVTDGTIVHMDGFDYIDPPRNGLVTAGAGVTMLEIMKELENDWQIEVVPEIGNATAGSVACCGTKDASLGRDGLGQISSTVAGIKMVDARGELVELTSREDLKVARSSYGLLGVVYEVTFRIRPRRTVRYEYASLDLASLPTLDAVRDGADGFLAFMFPYRPDGPRLLVERRSVIDAKAGFFDGVRKGLRNFLWENAGQLADSPDRRIWLKALDASLETTFESVIRRFDVQAGNAMIDFKRGGGQYFEFSFWAFPASKWLTVVPAYLAFCRDFQSRTGFRSALPTEVYFIRKDDSALLSFCPTEDIFTLDLVDVVGRSRHGYPMQSQADQQYWRQLNDEFNDFAASHGARPLLNQTKWIKGRHVSAARAAADDRPWTPALDAAWRTFAGKRASADPEDRFLTPFFRDLL